MSRRIPTPRATKGPSGPAADLYKRLRALGCTFCAECNAYLWPEHAHVSLWADRHDSRYVLVGGYGDVKAIDTRAPDETAVEEAA